MNYNTMCREELIDYSKYIISKDGTFYSKFWKKAIKGWVDKDGYLVSTLMLKNGKQQPYRRNRVIAYLFVEKPTHLKDIPYDELQVGHQDTDKKNNNADNLYWCTSKENNNNPITKMKQRKNGLKEEKIRVLRMAYEKYIENGGKNGFKGKRHSDETKKKMSEIRTKYWDKKRNSEL